MPHLSSANEIAGVSEHYWPRSGPDLHFNM